MKIETDFENPKVQISLQSLAQIEGIIIHIYYYSGDRYNYFSDIISFNDKELKFIILSNKQEGKEFGTINIMPENEDEKKLFVFPNDILIASRDKETEKYYLIKTNLEIKKNSFVYHRNKW